MDVPDAARGPLSLLTLGASFALRHPARTARAAFAALPLPVALALMPAAAAWSAVVTARALASAIRIGHRVRSAPILHPHRGLVVPPAQIAPLCSLVSDTHVTADRAVPCELVLDAGQWPFRDLPVTGDLARGLRDLLAHVRDHAPRTVIWCGDEVDTGAPAEWAEWRSAIAGFPELAHRLVPGNHDVCFNQPFDEDFTLARRAARERAFQAHGDRLADYPVVDTIVSDHGAATVILLDSCKHRSTHVLSNAIGLYGEIQLGEIARVLASRSGPVLVISHHHVWRDARFLQPDEWYNTAVDADRLAHILLAYRARAPHNHVLVCHGHRHAMTTGTITDGHHAIDVAGLPSSTLGDKSRDGVLDGIVRYTIAGLRADGTWGISLISVRRLVAAELARRPTPRTPPSAALVALSALPVDHDAFVAPAVPGAGLRGARSSAPRVRLVASRRST
jgi:uncharacterized Zn-binding protein involved in type VI secretion